MRVWLFFQVCHLDHPSCQPRVRGSLECTAKKGNDDYKVQLWIPTILTGTRVSSNFLLEVFQGKEIGQNGVAFPRRGEFTKRSKQIWVSEGQTLFDCVVCPPDLSEVQVIYFLKNAPDQRELFDQVLSQGQTISSDWSLQGYIASTPLPPFGTLLQNSLQAGGSYCCNSVTVWVLLLFSPTSPLLLNKLLTN